MWFDQMIVVRGTRRALAAVVAVIVAFGLAGLLANTAWPRMHHPARGHRIMPSGAVLDLFAQPAGAYSFRKLRTAYAGPAVKLRRTVDNALLDIGFLGYGFDVAAANGHCTTACTVDTWYDQSGNGRHVINGTPAGQPNYIAQCLGTQPCARVTSATQNGLATAPQTWAGKTTISVVANRNSGTGQCYFASKGSNILVGQGATANNWYLSDQAVMAYALPASDAAWHAGVATMDGVASAARVDSTDIAGANVPGNTGSAALSLAIGAAATTCSLAEAILWDNYAVTQLERVALNDNQRNYWMPLSLDSFTQPSGAYSFRKLKSTYAGSAIRIRRASDNAELDINFLGCTGFTGCPWDEAAAVAHCAATSCFARTWYDQSGSTRDLVMATAGSQPPLVFSCNGSLPCLQTSVNGGAVYSMATASTFTPSGVVSLSVVGRRSAGTGSCTFVQQTTNQNRVIGNSVAHQWAQLPGVVVSGATDNVWHAFNGTINGASGVTNLDGTEGASSAAGSVVVGAQAIAGSATATCHQSEVVLWNAYATTLAERAALQTNQKGFWGTP